VAKREKKQAPGGNSESWWKRLPWDNKKWIRTFHALESMVIAAVFWNAFKLFSIAIGKELGGPFGRYATVLISYLFNFLYFKFGFLDVMLTFFPGLAERWSVWRKERTDERTGQVR